MNEIKILFVCLIISISISCKKNKEESKNYTLNGKAQKGPFITGTLVTLNELNSNLGQTGKSFTTSITGNNGSFNLNNVSLNSNLALLTANGFYFSEIYGQLSAAPITLQAITNLSNKENVNINVLTHMIRGRIENLVSKGMNFNDANNQAKSEFLSFLGVTNIFNEDFENLDISKNEDRNAVLLAISVMLQRYTTILGDEGKITAELTQLLSTLNEDFASDGLISNRSSIDQILNNISQLNLIEIRDNIVKKNIELNQSDSIPNFEKYIAQFQQKHSNNIYTNFTYPLMASPEPIIAPDIKIKNILVPNDTIYESGPYSIAAIIPLNKNLKIKFIFSGPFSYDGVGHGWEIINNFPDGFTLNSQRQNALMTMGMNLESEGSATIEYYENNSNSPSFIKKITWK
jgi:hypothetical protein